MPGFFRAFSLLLLLSPISTIEVRAVERPAVDSGKERIVLEDFDSHELRWQRLVEFDKATLRIAGKQGLVWKQEFDAGEPLRYDPMDLDGAPLPDGAYTYEWRLWIPLTDADRFETKLHTGRFKIQEGVVLSLERFPPEADLPLLTNPLGNHFAGNLTTDSELCVGCIDGAYAGVTANTGLVQATIRSKGEEPGIILHEDTTIKEYWMLNSYSGIFQIEDLPTTTETDWTIPFRIESQAPTSSFFLSSSGSIGLGTTTPSEQVHLYRDDPNDPPAIVFEHGGVSPQAFRLEGGRYGWGVYDLTDGGSSRFMIEAGSGDVCIGLFSECFNVDAALHIASLDSRILVEDQSPTTAVRTQFQLWNNGAPRFAIKNRVTGIEWSFQQSSTGNFLISKEGTGGPELQVYGGGRVRMGPAGAKNFDLDPSGNLTIKGSLTANGSTFPDYVFGPDYELMSLSDLQTFIHQEQRLPDIPSAEDVKEQGGHNMTELQIKLLEKIEELTLYTLAQEKKLQRVEALERENARMKAELAEIRAILSDR